MAFAGRAVSALNAHSKGCAKHDWFLTAAKEEVVFEMRGAVAAAQALRFVASAVAEWEVAGAV